MTFGSTRPSQNALHACLAPFLILALTLGGITFTPRDAAAAGSRSAKAKKEQKERKERAESQELQAREEFAAGRYQEALDTYAKLYAETLHPTYLRNVGRCYMNMDEPERAVNSFREYLRKAKDLTPEENKEVEGFIEEMEVAIKKKEDEAAAAAAVDAKPVDPTPSPQPKLVVQPPPKPIPAPKPAPFYTKGWFWGVVGGVVVVGVLGGLWAGGAFSKNNCVDEFQCLPN
jgi:hypothetical protein